MENLSLILSVLEHVRYTVLINAKLCLSDFEENSDVYNYIASVNEASNELASLIDVLRVYKSCTK